MSANSIYSIDFTHHDGLNDDDKKLLSFIQDNYNPIERVDSLLDFIIQGKITNDEFETLTGLPHTFIMS